MGAQATTDNKKVVRDSEVIIISVKPSIVPKALAELTEPLKESKLFLSIAMGIPIQQLENVSITCRDDSQNLQQLNYIGTALRRLTFY